MCGAGLGWCLFDIGGKVRSFMGCSEAVLSLRSHRHHNSWQLLLSWGNYKLHSDSQIYSAEHGAGDQLGVCEFDV